MHDLIIVGAGPAGITAAVYAARRMMDVLVVSKNVGGQAALTAEIENYTGYQFISGHDLADRFREHIEKYGISLKEEEALSVTKSGEVFTVNTPKGSYQSGAVILALGGRPKTLDVPGESEYQNRGVTYCPICDGPLFVGKDVAVIGGGNSALSAAVQLMPIARKIFLITVNSDLAGDNVLIEKVKGSGVVEIITRTETKEFTGGKFLSGVRVLTGGKEERLLSVEGAFIEIGWTPAVIPIKSDEGTLKLTAFGEVMVSDRFETSIPGLYAAGDVSSTPERQIIVAAGQGCIASLSAFKYLSKKSNKV
ncbi:MAG: FAD-dependent oxidoreductase [Candidatus Altiarchaeota archaeon]|nr:FAD-dependent oxidoreductase [Candidatus Altiarchaeota archaeon]